MCTYCNCKQFEVVVLLPFLPDNIIDQSNIGTLQDRMRKREFKTLAIWPKKSNFFNRQDCNRLDEAKKRSVLPYQILEDGVMLVLRHDVVVNHSTFAVVGIAIRNMPFATDLRQRFRRSMGREDGLNNGIRISTHDGSLSCHRWLFTPIVRTPLIQMCLAFPEYFQFI